MESNLTGTLNAGLCLVTVLALFLYRRNGARYKPGIRIHPVNFTAG